MKNRIWIVIILISFFSCKVKKQRTTVKNNIKPNIILLFSDDQSFKDVHALGNKEVKTPTMDSFVEQGVLMTHAYNMGGWNGAVCVASPYLFISGRSIWRAQQISERYAKDKDLDKT